MKKLIIFGFIFCYAKVFAQSILLDAKSTAPATMLLNRDLTLKRIAMSSTPTIFTAVIRNHNSIFQFSGGEIQSIGSGADGSIIYIMNTGTTPLTIRHQFTTGTTAANRIVSHTGYDFNLGSNQTLTLIYDSTIDRWRISEIFVEPWTYFGNNSTNNLNYIGTTDEVSLKIKTNNTDRLIIGPSLGYVGIGPTTPFAPFHVSKGVSGVTTTGNMTAIFEDNTSQNIGIYENSAGTNSKGAFLYLKKPNSNAYLYSRSTFGELIYGDLIVLNNTYDVINGFVNGNIEIGDPSSNRPIKLNQNPKFNGTTYSSSDPEIISSIELNNNGFASSAYNILRLTGSTKDYTLTGIPFNSNQSAVMHIVVDDSNLTIKNDSAVELGYITRINTGNGGDLTITGNGGVTLVYNTNARRWFVVDFKL